MKIAAAQIRAEPGNLETNIQRHQRLIDLAVALDAELVIFPELSITGYEPMLAQQLATRPEDPRFDGFQQISDQDHITIAIGAPTPARHGVCISLVLFHPGQARQVYSKMHLTAAEKKCFVPGPATRGLVRDHETAALAICYELSVPEHARNASNSGADIYLASVAHTPACNDKSFGRLAEIAREHSLFVLMSNLIGAGSVFEFDGRTSAWNRAGELLIQLDDDTEGIIVVDTNTQQVCHRTVE